MAWGGVFVFLFTFDQPWASLRNAAPTQDHRLADGQEIRRRPTFFAHIRLIYHSIIGKAAEAHFNNKLFKCTMYQRTKNGGRFRVPCPRGATPLRGLWSRSYILVVR